MTEVLKGSWYLKISHEFITVKTSKHLNLLRQFVSFINRKWGINVNDYNYVLYVSMFT